MALVGPRQCGKTTLAQAMGGAYYDLELEPERLRLDLEWQRRAAGRELVILDEAQSWPEVFPRLRSAIDADRGRNGRFLLLGSVAPALMTKVSESLAGRLSLIELTPFLLAELADSGQRDRHWLVGGFPDGGILRAESFPRWQRDYLTVFTQRDLPNWGLPARPQTVDRLIKMLAAVHGQPWNAQRIGQSMGLSYHTVNTYLDFLVNAFLFRRLPAYHANLHKRLVKSPKLFWRDTGLLHAVLNITDEAGLLAQPWVGASWEGYVVEQALGVLANGRRHADAYWFRTADQHELDLVLDFGAERWAFEIKLTASPSPADLQRLDKTADLIQASRRYLVSRTPSPVRDGRRISCDLPTLLADLAEIAA